MAQHFTSEVYFRTVASYLPDLLEGDILRDFNQFLTTEVGRDVFDEVHDAVIRKVRRRIARKINKSKVTRMRHLMELNRHCNGQGNRGWGSWASSFPGRRALPRRAPHPRPKRPLLPDRQCLPFRWRLSWERTRAALDFG